MFNDIIIPRDVYKEFFKWKNENLDKVLFVKGSRYVGKTYLVKNFVKKNFEKSFYLNLFSKNGKEFIRMVDSFNYRYNTLDLLNILKSFFRTFEDNDSTAIVIDEIQEDYKVSDIIRKLNKYTKCKFILVGSNLGRITPKHLYKNNKDLKTINMKPLSFKEFLRVLNKDMYYRFNDLGLSKDVDKGLHECLCNAFKLYLQVGGYPAIVKSILINKDFNRLNDMYKDIIVSNSMECARFLGEQRFYIPIKNSFNYISTSLINKDNPSEKILNLDIFGVKQFELSDYKKLMLCLLHFNVVYEANKNSESRTVDNILNEYFYFNDVGMLNSLLSSVCSLQDRLVSLIENYLYLTLDGFSCISIDIYNYKVRVIKDNEVLSIPVFLVEKINNIK